MRKGPPTGLPKTQDELRHLQTVARRKGAGQALTIILYVLMDKYGWDADGLNAMMHHVTRQLDAVHEGRMNLVDVTRTLREEYQVNIYDAL